MAKLPTKTKASSKASSKASPKASTKSIKAEEQFSIDNAQQSFAPVLQDSMQNIRHTFLKLADNNSPQVLLIDGGKENERMAAALWWASIEHCQNRSQDIEPCGQCPDCLQIGAIQHLDLFVFDGRISNTEDKENPSTIRALNIENIRQLKSKLGESTHSDKKRIIILNGLSITRDAAANALLKVLEEPSSTSLFVLLSPQKQQLLPTLVSRSWSITLPWANPYHVDASMQGWENALASFITSGRDLWSLTSVKGGVSEELAYAVILLCQKRLLSSIVNNGEISRLIQIFSNISQNQRLLLMQNLEEAQEQLIYNVNPARVLELLAIKFHQNCQ